MTPEEKQKRKVLQFSCLTLADLSFSSPDWFYPVISCAIPVPKCQTWSSHYSVTKTPSPSAQHKLF